MAKRMNSDKRLYVARVYYHSLREKNFVFDTRADAADFKRAKLRSKAVGFVQILPAERGPSNVGAR